MNKKIFPLILTIIIITIIAVTIIILQNTLSTPKSSISQESTPDSLSIEKIVLYSNATALNDYSNPWWNLNVYQYTDIAIYLKNSSEISNSSCIKIDNIQFLEGPNLGEPFISYISPLNLGKTPENIHLLEEQNSIEYEIKDFSQDEQFETPTFFNNFSSPLTMRYVNKNIVKDYVLNSDTSSLTFDGSLLQKCLISAEDVSCKISFDITLLNTNHKYNVVFDIPIEGPIESIYDGSILEIITKENLSIKPI